MISERLYELAFLYKKTRLWEKLSDTQIFAVKLSGERIGYVSIMGLAGQHCALGLYIGDEGFESFRAILKMNEFVLVPLLTQEQLLQQKSLQCTFESKDMLSEDEREEVKQYARSHGIRIAGKNAYPQFVKYEPYCCPWHLQKEQEQQDLCEALSAAIALSGFLEEKQPIELGIVRMNGELTEIPLLEVKNGSYVVGKTEIPAEKEERFPTPSPGNDIAIANLKKQKQKGIWECRILRFPNPVQNHPDEIPFFPVILLAVESNTGFMLPVSPAAHYEEHPEELLNQFIDAFLAQKICPKKIKAADKRTYEFAKGLCDKLKISISLDDELPELEEAEESFWERFGMSEEEELEEISQMMDAMKELSEEELSKLPADMVEFLQSLMESDVLLTGMDEKITPISGGKNPTEGKKRGNINKKTNSAGKGSYIISVSIGAGCYRHIRISANSTLWQLHSAILEAFGFDDDHAHAFFMDNIKWSEADCYYVEGIERYYRTTKKYRLNQVGLYKGKQFKYVFDFGDEWTFQCKVLQILDAETIEPVVVRTKGEAPEQYAQWDDEWDDE